MSCWRAKLVVAKPRQVDIKEKEQKVWSERHRVTEQETLLQTRRRRKKKIVHLRREDVRRELYSGRVLGERGGGGEVENHQGKIGGVKGTGVPIFGLRDPKKRRRDHDWRAATARRREDKNDNSDFGC